MRQWKRQQWTTGAAHGLVALVLATTAACGGSTSTPATTTDEDATTDVAADVQTSDLAQASDVADDAATLPAPHTDTLGGARPVPVTVPDNWTPTKKWPLILVLHGYGASGAIQSGFLGVEARATQYGYVTLAPDGTLDPSGQLFWNATPACCDFGHVDVDDVAYLSGLIDEAVAQLAVDPARVYIVGHSNGGFMAYRLACEKSDKVNAIAVIAGAINPDPAACAGAKPVNVLHIHGTGDKTIGYDGGSIQGGAFPSAAVSIGDWVARDACDVTPTTAGTADYDMVIAGEETTRLQYPGCANGLAVEHWKMAGSGHIPGFTDAFREALPTWFLARTRP